MTLHRLLPSAALALCIGSCVGCHRAPTESGLPDRIVWSVDLPNADEGQSVLIGDALIVATDSGLSARALSDGSERWRSLTRNVHSERLLTDDRRVYTAAVGIAGAYRIVDGTTVWERELGQAASPDFAESALDADAFYIGTRDRRVLALSTVDGHTLWDVPLDAEGWPFGGVVGGITIAGDTVYVGAKRALNANAFEEAMVLVALDRRTGRELWRYQAPGTNTGTTRAPTVAGRNLVLAGSKNGITIALDRFTTRELWRRTLYGLIYAPFVRAGDRVFAATKSARAYALDPATGVAGWDREMSAGANFIAVCDDELVINSYNIEMLDLATGASHGIAFRTDGSEFATSGVVVANGRAYIGGNHKLYAVRCGSGRNR